VCRVQGIKALLTVRHTHRQGRDHFTRRCGRRKHQHGPATRATAVARRRPQIAEVRAAGVEEARGCGRVAAAENAGEDARTFVGIQAIGAKACAVVGACVVFTERVD